MTDFRDAYGLAKTDPDWPDRLLHVESWTSHVRGEDNSYGGSIEPRFNIISYTWGRWMLDCPGPALPLEGITWDVPAVDPEESFTVDQFRKVVQQVAHDVKFIWLDVACIDQNDRRAKMREIGRQASIFECAASGFVWLHQWSDEQLERNVRKLDEAWSTLENYSVLLSDVGFDNDDSVDYEVPSCFTDDSWIDTVIEILEIWRSEPWFTSLWTFEEMYLKPTATFLSKSAGTVSIRGEPAGLNWLMDCVDTLDEGIRALSWGQPFPEHLDQTRLNKILIGTDCLGLGSEMWQNSCVVFAATRHRTVREPRDRVYAIMQVFGFQLGESVDPDGSFTLPQLQLQLVAAMAERHPVFSQLFLHTQPVPLGHGWMVGDHSRTTLRLRFKDLRPQAMCEIEVDQSKAIATFKGYARDFQTFADLYKKIVILEGDEECDTWQDIMFDCNPKLLEFISEDILDQDRVQDNRFHEVGDLLVKAFGDRLRLLFLGALQDADHEFGQDDDDGDEKDLGIGLLALAEQTDKGTVWRRIGLCVWREPGEDSEHFEEFGNMWKPFSGTLG